MHAKGKALLRMSLFCQRYTALITHDDMIQYLSANHVEGNFEDYGQCAICLTGLRITGRTVMH
ncbi:hypothetical protein D3C84_1086150 [compost metagenome]